MKFIYSTILKQLSLLPRSHNAEERSIFKTEAYFLDFAVTIHIMRPPHQRCSCTFLASYWFIRVSLACVDNPLPRCLSEYLYLPVCNNTVEQIALNRSTVVSIWPPTQFSYLSVFCRCAAEQHLKLSQILFFQSQTH